MDDVFRALADPGRRKLLDSLRAHDGQTLRELCTELAMARQSVSKHLAILEAAGLVATVRHGREKLHYLNAAPISEIGERWISHYDRARVDALADLKRALEEPTMSNPAVTTETKPSFVYTTYIRTTPEQLWRGLTDPAFTERYWNITFDTDWKPGSAMTWHHGGVRIEDPEQVVLASEPFTRLSYSWHATPTAWAEAYGISDDVRAKLAAEPRSTATFLIEDGEPFVKLTVVHEVADADSTLLTMVSNGWPQVLAALKTMLETGRAPAEPVA